MKQQSYDACLQRKANLRDPDYVYSSSDSSTKHTSLFLTPSHLNPPPHAHKRSSDPTIAPPTLTAPTIISFPPRPAPIRAALDGLADAAAELAAAPPDAAAEDETAAADDDPDPETAEAEAKADPEAEEAAGASDVDDTVPFATPRS